MIAPDVAQPRRDRSKDRGTARARALVECERIEPSLGDFLATIHGDLAKAVLQRWIGETREKGVGIAAQILARRSNDTGGGFHTHKSLYQRPHMRISRGLVHKFMARLQAEVGQCSSRGRPSSGKDGPPLNRCMWNKTNGGRD